MQYITPTPRIIFYGTPEFAVAPLDYLVKNGYHIVSVVTAPDKRSGRGKKLNSPPVKNYAEKNNIPVLQPVRLKNESFLEEVKKLDPDIQVVVAFRMMPKELWSIPPKGTFNLHASLLPQYRGAAPINHVIINGEKETGLTTFFIDEKIDTGEIIFQERMEIGENETAGELHDRMMVTGSKLVEKTVRAISEGKLKTHSQSKQTNQGKELKTAPKIFRENCRINWSENGEKIHRMIRGLSPYPAAFSYMTNRNKKIQVKVLKSEFEQKPHNIEPGTILSDGKTWLTIAVPDGYIKIIRLKPEGRSALNIKDFLNGFSHPEDWTMK